MDIVVEWLWNLLDAGLQLLIQPFVYISILLIILQYRRQVVLERKLYHTRLHSWESQTLRSIFGGGLAGIGVSIVAIFLGLEITFEGMICVWVVSIILMLLRIRYLCLAYAVGLLGVVQFGLDLFPDWTGTGLVQTAVQMVRDLNIPSLLVLVALLHIAEALLVRWQGESFAAPLFYEGKRGRVVGGYQLQNFWPVPLFLLVPVSSGGSTLPWTPLLSDGNVLGFALIGLPVMIGFAEMTVSLLPAEKVRITTRRLLIYSIVLLVLAIASSLWSPLMLVAALVALLWHEGIALYSRYHEQHSSPIFVHPNRGLKVLAVLPDSPAEQLGICAGEVINKVNGMLITTKEELHAALRINPAFCKLEVQNIYGEMKFKQRAIYDGDHHLLGVILAPDDDAPLAVRGKPTSLLELLFPRRNRSRGHAVNNERVSSGQAVSEEAK